MERKLFSSESVTRGHPDKVCDQIADRILDELLRQDPESRVACEVTCATDQVHIFGEVTTQAKVDYAQIARSVIHEIGYTEPGHGFDSNTCRITVDLHQQSGDIARGISRKREVDMLDNGAGDQGMMFGYACRETENLMPMPIELAHALVKRLEEVRVDGTIPYLLPDGKAQVTVEYDGDRPVHISDVVVSAQHRADVLEDQLREDIIEKVVKTTMPKEMLDEYTQYYINPTGRFVIGGPAGDSGLTGRKLIVDTYGGMARHGGGAFSGKDASKVDRSGAYMARYIAKNIVAQGFAERCEVQLSYAIGLANPMALRIDTFGTEKIDSEKLYDAVMRSVDARPMAIIRKFGLTEPIFSKVACYGHFGSNAKDMPWEQTDLKFLIND